MWTVLYGILFLTLVESRGLPTVETNHGVVRGKWLSSANNLTVAAFLGIPYAMPPVGELRFQSPQPWTQNWTYIRDAMEDAPMCIQLNRNKIVLGSEDCLYLNIFVPVIAKEKELPVLVFVHGGGFNIGSSNSTLWAPDYLMDQGIILVTVNYRLGIFGFLSSTTSAVPGNMGLKDIVQALRWMQDNIAYFGGDPKAVTIMGHSAGAAAVQHLALSESTEGLFERYIAQSGSAFASWGTHSPYWDKRKFFTVARELGCLTDEQIKIISQMNPENVAESPEEFIDFVQTVEIDEQIVNCMRFKSSSALAQTMTLFHYWRYHPSCNFGPTIEIDSDDPIIERHPVRTVERGEFRDIPFMTGLVADEGLLKSTELFRNRAMLDEFMDHFNDYVPFFLEYTEVLENVTLFGEALKEFYFSEDEIDSHDLAAIDRNLTRMAGDGLISWATYRGLNILAQSMNSSAYFYVFAYEGTFSSTFTQTSPRRYGVAHSDELNYLFPFLNEQYEDFQLHNTESDETMINIMTEMWANFVKDGVPSARLVEEWEPFDEQEGYMAIGKGKSLDVYMEKDFLPRRMGFWEYLMANVSIPMDKLFLESLYDDEENEIDSASAAELSKFLQVVIFTLFLVYEIL